MAKILISGSTGLIGTALTQALLAQKHSVTGLGRSKHAVSYPQILWNPVARVIDLKQLEGFDAVIHLAGDPIAHGRWTPEKKAQIRDSRVKGTRFLSESLAKLASPPKSFLCASAIGIYGERGEETLTEESAPGTGFLPETGVEWEGACSPAADKGIRVVNLRFGVVLSGKGGALPQMLPPFKMGAGGILGTGKQWMSWVSIADVTGAILHAISNESVRGPVNIVSPNPVTNADFTQTLGRVLRRPAFIPMPAFGVRILFGQMGDDLLLASARVEPKRLKATDYPFKHADLETALKYSLTEE